VHLVLRFFASTFCVSGDAAVLIDCTAAGAAAAWIVLGGGTNSRPGAAVATLNCPKPPTHFLYNAWSIFIIFLLRNPHLLEGAER